MNTLSPPQSDLLIFVSIVILGVGAVALIAKKPRRKQFSLKRYVLLLLFPMLATAFAFHQIGMAVLYVFLLSASVGMLLEYLIGRSFYVIEGARMWRYYRYDFSGNTSWLALPLWGMAGVLFMLIARAV